MEPGFGQNLEGFLIKGNLSLAPAQIPILQGDGSLEGSGTLYFDVIKEYNNNYGVTLQDVVFQNEHVYVPYTTPSTNLTSACIVLEGGITIKHTQNSTSTTSGGGLTIAGGASIGKTLNVGGLLDVNGNYIANVAWPNLGTDGVNKDYVDSVADRVSGNFTIGQVIIADSNGDAIRGYDFFTLSETQLTLDKPFVITNSTDALDLSSGSLVVIGGASFGKDVNIGGILDLNGNVIENVGYPVNDTDVATKQYVDDQGVNGNFTTGQILVADTGGNAIRGYDTFTFSINSTSSSVNISGSTSLIIYNTEDAYGLSSGSLISYGGASFDKSVYIGGQLDVNLNRITSVDTPIDALDAVNKAYVDALVSSGIGGGGDGCCDLTATAGNTSLERLFILNNNIVIPEDITTFTFTTDTKAFVSYIYVEYIDTSDRTCALYTIRGMNNDGEWVITNTYIGEKTNVDFYIRYDGSQAIIQYTNLNTSGITTIRFRTPTNVTNGVSSGQSNILLSNNILTYTDVPGLAFVNSQVNSVQVVISVSNSLDNAHGVYFLNCVLKNNVWTMNSYYIGDDVNIYFKIVTQSSIGYIQYINQNVTGTYVARIQRMRILKTQDTLLLLANTSVPTNIDTSDFNFANTKKSFIMTVYVEVPDENKYALYELEGYVCDNIWKINSRFVGDRTGIVFYIATSGDIGYIGYTNLNGVDANIRFFSDVPKSFAPIPVGRGGTGNTTLLPYAVLRGNGTDPIVATEDFIYKDYQLILGNLSSIILNNTQPALNLTSGTFVTYGGISIGKNLIVGDTLVVKGVDVTPSIGDISAERSFYANNNQMIPDDIVGFDFSNVNIKSFSGVICVTITTLTDEYDALFDLKGLKKKNDWLFMASCYIGDNVGIKFSMTSSGQVQYTSTNIVNWVSTLMKFRAMTTSI
jgi:hypothetical protein